MTEIQAVHLPFDQKKCLKIVILATLTYLILANIAITTLLLLGFLGLSVLAFIKIKIAEFRQKGPQNFSPGMRKLLFEKSIFDIYSDIIYFPTISKIIGAFIRPLVAKPHPQQLKNTFEDIPPKAKEIISTKGILNIFPDKVRAIGYKEDEPLPQVIKNNWSWYNADKYKLHEQVHQDTLGKRITERIDQKISWKSLAVLILLVAYGIRKMHPKRAQKMLIQNGSFTGVLLVIIIGLIKLNRQNKMKVKKSLGHLEIQAKLVDEE